MIGNHPLLEEYLLRAPGIGRVALNLKCALGVIVLGWLMVVAFEQLGRKFLGWAYALPFAAIVVFFPKDQPIFLLAAAAVYGAGWVHANQLLGRIESLAAKRLGELDRAEPATHDADLLLERGVLRAKVMQRHELAVGDFDAALRHPGGDPRLLGLAGVQASRSGHDALARQCFERALESVDDAKLREQITKNLAVVAGRTT
jgi:hypothetical protein